MTEILRGVKLGQILMGEDLRIILNLLVMVHNLQRFSHDLKVRCPFLGRFQTMIYPLPKLKEAIDKAIDEDGNIKDDATPTLKNLRRAKIALRKNIENQIRQLLVEGELETYIQDKFFTIRRDRYVVPIRVDGRGRVKGSIYDTSDSGQTLFIEPTAIAPLNENLLDLEIAEKLEISRIFRSLSSQATSEHGVILQNYEAVTEIDILSAKARLAYELDAVQVQMSDTPVLNLRKAYHPLVTSPSGERATPNDISLENQQKVLIISGPNAGGKTVVLKTVGILQLMAKAGLLIPAHPDSQIYLFDEIYIAMGDTQNIVANLSTFSGHLTQLKPILEKASERDLVLLDELAVGTEPQTGSAIAQAILEHLGSKNITSLVTTHFDSLKAIAFGNSKFRNGSLEFLTKNLKPTYNLVLDVPGQSYGIELAEHLGLPQNVIGRAKELKGKDYNEFDHMVKTLAAMVEEAKREKDQWQTRKLEMESQKDHWEKEKKELEKIKGKATDRAYNEVQGKYEKLATEFYETLDQLKKLMKSASEDPSRLSQIEAEINLRKNEARDKLANLEQGLSQIEANTGQVELPGKPCTIDELTIGDKVFVLFLRKEATVTTIYPGEPNPTIEVQIGLLKVKASIQDLRLLDKKAEPPKVKPKPFIQPRDRVVGGGAPSGKSKDIGLVITTPTNSLDLRGKDADSAVDAMWQFIDKGVMRGENHLVIIHGHGTDKLKKVVRTALAKGDDYQLDFRPGQAEEGGDGVTIILLNQ
jgi:DNA mismatch repair protein MutS2